MTKFQKLASLSDFIINPKKDIEIFGMFGPGNLGDEAMLVAALDNLPKNRCLPWQSYAHRPMLKELVRKRRRQHLLVAGGTLIHGGKTGWLDYVEMRSQQGARVSFFGTGIAFTESEIATRSKSYRRWSEVLKRSEEVHLRGQRSVELCRQMGCTADVFGDFAFLLHQPEVPITNHSARCETIGLNFGDCLGDQDQFEDACVALVKHLSPRHKLAFSVVVRSDMEATQRIINRANIPEHSYTVTQHYFDPKAFINEIRDYRAFIGLKLHAAGLAMVAGVPALMIAYKPKSYDFMAPLTKQDHMLLNLPLEIKDLLARTERLIEAPHDFTVVDKIAGIAGNQREILRRVFEE